MGSKVDIDSLVEEFLRDFKITNEEEVDIHKMCLRKALEQISDKYRNDEEKRLREYLEEQKGMWQRQLGHVNTTQNPALHKGKYLIEEQGTPDNDSYVK